MAMAMLAVQEAIRRKVLIAFAVFVAVMLFAGWYLDVKSEHPARLYLSFVLTASNYLVVLLALFLSTFRQPRWAPWPLLNRPSPKSSMTSGANLTFAHDVAARGGKCRNRTIRARCARIPAGPRICQTETR